LYLSDGTSTDYDGYLRAVRGSASGVAGGVYTVNRVNDDRYTSAVVPREMPASWQRAAVYAQAVAARTYAAYNAAHPASAEYDLCDTTSCQVYGGASAEDPAATAAVKATRGQVVLYEGQPAFTQFSSSNGGYSSAGSQPYLVAQADPYEASSDNPNDPWTATVTRAQIEKAWPGVGTLANLSFTRDGLGAQLGGRVTSVRITGSLGGLPTAVNVTGDDFRSRLALKSTWLQLAKAPARSQGR
jgi:SpoIID/LytB domain protein